MKRFLLSAAAFIGMFIIMRWQGQILVTPQSPAGILNLEFAWSSEKLQILQLFWPMREVYNNIYLDFLFIAAYTWFFLEAVNRTQVVFHPGITSKFSSVAVAAALFDACENFLLYLILIGRFSPSILKVVYVVAAVKFLLIAILIIYLLVALVRWLAGGQKKHLTS